MKKNEKLNEQVLNDEVNEGLQSQEQQMKD